MLFDELLTNYVGEMGNYQVMILCIIFIEELVIGFLVMSPVFTAATPDHHCRHPEAIFIQNCSDDVIRKWTLPEGDAGKCNYLTSIPNFSRNFSEFVAIEDGTTDICQFLADTNATNWSTNTTESCTEWIYDQSLYTKTMVTEWNLVCQDAWMTKTISSTYLAGMAVGAFVFGWMADRIGRRNTSFVAGIPNVLIGVATAVVPNYYAFVVLRFFHGALSSGKTVMGLLIALEFTGTSKRVYVGAGYAIAWAVGYVICGGIAYAIRDWRHMMLAITLPEVIYYILLYFFVPETPRWLYVRNRKTEADKIVIKMAKFNKARLPDQLDVTEPYETSAVSPIDLFRTRHLLKATLILIFVWAANGLTYYGISLNTSRLAGDPYVNFVISGAVEIPAYLFIMITFPFLGRIWSFSLSMIAAGLSLLLILAIPAGMPEVVTGLAMMGKFFITSTYTMAYVYTPEVYPTCIRSLGLNICNIASKVAAPIAPFVTLLDVFHPAISTIIFGGMAVVAGLLLIPMPETKGKPMVQTIEEGEHFNKTASSGLFCFKKCLAKRNQSMQTETLSMVHQNGDKCIKHSDDDQGDANGELLLNRRTLDSQNCN